MTNTKQELRDALDVLVETAAIYGEDQQRTQSQKRNVLRRIHAFNTDTVKAKVNKALNKVESIWRQDESLAGTDASPGEEVFLSSIEQVRKEINDAR